MEITEEVLAQRDDLIKWIKGELASTSISVYGEGNRVIVEYQDVKLCEVSVGTDGYQIITSSSDWIGVTTYHYETEKDGTYACFMESEDECIAECRRLVLLEMKNKPQIAKENASSTESNRDRFFDIIYPVFEGSRYTLRKCKEGKYKGKIIEIIDDKTGNHDIDIWCHTRNNRLDILITDRKCLEIPDSLGLETKSQKVADNPKLRLAGQHAKSFQNIEEDALFEICKYVATAGK